MQRRGLARLGGVLLAVALLYGAAFGNGFHFDDFHTVVDNPAVRTLDVGRFFRDATAFSVLPANQTYRPLVTLSLAVDYALGRGYVPQWFHAGTLVLFLLLIAVLYELNRLLLGRTVVIAGGAAPSPGQIDALALFAAAWFGLHPAMAETVNYVIQRGDLYCTLGCVAALFVFARWPRLRGTGLYLLPFAAAMLSKPPSAIFPLLLLAYLLLFELPDSTANRWRRALWLCLPSLLLDVALLALQSAMTPKSYAPTMLSAADYRLTQPYVWLRYVGELFLPLHLNVDTDLQAFHGLNARAVLGLLFVAALLVAIVWSARRPRWAPVAFGLAWFVLTQVPTSIYALSEVENDHRMFFSFPGLMLAVVWALWLLLGPALQPRLRASRTLQRAAWSVVVLLLCAYGYGAYRRNLVWRDEATLWRDDVEKSPNNGRGLMNYGLAEMARGDDADALKLFERALRFTPNYATLEVNLGIVNGDLADRGDGSRTAVAEQHFRRAMLLAPADATTHSFYGRWLNANNRSLEAIAQLQTAIALNPALLMPRQLLIEADRRAGLPQAAEAAAAQLRAVAPGDPGLSASLASPVAANVPAAAVWINASLALYQAGHFDDSIAAARRALEADPRSAVAWNNIAAAEASLGRWDEAATAARRSLALDPGLQLARNNLAWAENHGKAAAAR